MGIFYNSRTSTVLATGYATAAEIECALSNFPRAITLRVVDALNLELLPAELGILRNLVIKDCPQFRTLHELGGITDIKVCRCPSFDLTRSHEGVGYAYFRDCPSLTSVSGLKSVYTLDIRNCHGLTQVGPLHRSGLLYVEDCENVKEIGGSSEVKTAPHRNRTYQEFHSPRVVSLVALPKLHCVSDMRETQELEISNCGSLLAVRCDRSLNLRKVDIRDCPRLMTLQLLERVREVNITISNCPGVRPE